MNIALNKYKRFRAGLIRDAKAADEKNELVLRDTLLRQARLIETMKRERERVR